MALLRRVVDTARGVQKLRPMGTVRWVVTATVSHDEKLHSPTSWENARPYDEIPGPKPLPIVGNAWRFFPFIGEFHGLASDEMFQKLYDTYGPTCKLSGMPGRDDMVLVHDVKDVETIFRTEGTWPVRRGADSLEYYFKKVRKNRLNSLAFSHGEEWQNFRSAVNPTLMQPRNTITYVEPIDKVAQDFIDRMRTIRDEHDILPKDFQTELTKWSLESIAYVALDTRLGALTDFKPSSDAAIMVSCVRNVFECMENLDLKPSLWRFISTPSYRKLIANMNLFTETASKYVDTAMGKLKAASPNEINDRQLSVLQNLLLRTEDPSKAVAMALDLMLAGVDTTSMLTATILYQLAIHPEKQRKLQEELDQVIPDPQKPLTKEHMDGLKYLRACIKETMRVMPILTGNFRDTGKDVVLGGFQIPKGTITTMPAAVLQTNESYFPRAKEFIPERWMRETEGLEVSNAYAFLPFGFGPRMCVGKRFAQLEIESLLAKVFRNFTVEWNQPPVKTQFKLLLNFVSPLQFTVKDRV